MPAAQRSRAVKGHAYEGVRAYVVVEDYPKAVAFYKAAFGAKVVCEMEAKDKDGNRRVDHAELEFPQNGPFYVAQSHPDWNSKTVKSLGGSPVSLYFFTSDVDAAMLKASKAGAKITAPAATMFWGDRSGRLEDPEGISWSIMQRVEQVGNTEMNRRYALVNKGELPFSDPTPLKEAAKKAAAEKKKNAKAKPATKKAAPAKKAASPKSGKKK